MKLSIRAKLVAILFIASALPLLVGIVSVGFLGFSDFRINQGKLYRSSATHYANGLAQLTNDQILRLTDWTTLSNFPATVAKAPLITPKRAEYLEQNWPYYFVDRYSPKRSSPELVAVQENDVALQLKSFQGRNPLFKEIIVTDNNGFLLAATARPNNFIHSAEGWWKNTKRMPVSTDKVWVEGVAFDDYAAVNALKVCLPVRLGKRRIGIMKAVLNVSTLFSSVPVVLREDGLRHDVVQHDINDWRILARLTNNSYDPLSQRISKTVMRVLSGETKPNGSGDAQNGWLWASVDRPVGRDRLPSAPNLSSKETPDSQQPNSKQHSSVPGHDDLIGYANLLLNLDSVDEKAKITPMWVLVYNDTDHVFAPIYGQLKMQTIVGLLLLSTFLILGVMISQRKLVTPLLLLRGATAGLASTAQLEEEGAARAAQEKARQMVAQLQSINTHDEIQELAEDFATMSQRVLSYHEQLERELNAKTGEIQRDLQIAREFQESLLPREYPEVPAEGLQNALSLSFHHVYQPATSVCGDFFDVFKVSEGRAGVFIADVMGHGARSALVTAILRTLLQDLAGHDDNPAHILEQINRHFSGILRGTGQFVFASAFCMVIDTVEHRVDFASAGHPAPLVIDRENNHVEPLLPENFRDDEHSNAALGVDSESTYTRHTRDLRPGDAFFLFTDGVIEAPAPDKEEFGTEQLCDTLLRQINQPIARICRAVCEGVNEWMAGAPSPDDICVIGVEIGPPRHSVASPLSALEKTKK